MTGSSGHTYATRVSYKPPLQSHRYVVRVYTTPPFQHAHLVTVRQYRTPSLEWADDLADDDKRPPLTLTVAQLRRLSTALLAAATLIENGSTYTVPASGPTGGA